MLGEITKPMTIPDEISPGEEINIVRRDYNYRLIKDSLESPPRYYVQMYSTYTKTWFNVLDTTGYANALNQYGEFVTSEMQFRDEYSANVFLDFGY